MSKNQEKIIVEEKDNIVGVDFETVKSGKTQLGSVLGWKESLKDLATLPKWYKILLWVGVFVILFFNFFDVQGGTTGHSSYFIPISQFNDAKVHSVFGDNNIGAGYAVAVLYSLNGVAAFTGLLAVSMIVYNKPSQFFWGLINAIFYAAFALSVGYTGDFFMNLILILGALPGWWLVTHLFKVNKLQGHGKNFLISFWIGIFVIICFSIFLWMFMIPEASTTIFGNKAYEIKYGTSQVIDGVKVDGSKWGPLHILDGLVCGTELVGYAMQLTNIDQQFYIWFFVNVMKILKFTDIAPNTLSVNMLLQFVVWFTFSIIGLYERNFKDLFAKWFGKEELARA